MEKLEEKYLRWVMRLDSRTPRYMVRNELQREKFKGWRLAWRFEKRLREGREGN